MQYQSLTKLYYISPDEVAREYEKRFESPSAIHLPIEIKQYHRVKSYPAFFIYHNEMALIIDEFYKNYEEFLYLVHSVPPIVKQQFALLSILDEVKSTNDIEGVHSTRKEIREILDGNSNHSSRLKSVVNKYLDLLDANKEIPFDDCQDIRNFFDEFAHDEIIQDNPAHKLDGRLFRKDPVEIESAVGKVIHQGLFPEEEIIRAMGISLNILHSPELPILIRLAVFHYFFAYIHPFYDGNGRTDRFITSYYLGQHFHRLLALRFSIYVKKNRSTYYKLLAEADSELNHGDLTPFIIGFLKILTGSIRDTIVVLTRKQDQLEIYEKKIQHLGLRDPLLQEIYFILLQAALFYGQGITMAELMKVTKKNRGTIQKRINEIPMEQLLVSKINKTKYYKLNFMMFK